MINSDQPLQPLSQNELTELETFLVSDQTPEECMSSLEMIDGFMTAIVIGPETVPDNIWIPYLLNPENRPQPIFQTDEEAAEITALLVRHIGAIANQFETDPEEFLPLYEMFGYSEDEERELAIEEWALGFVLGMELTHEAWQPFFADEETAMLAGPVFILGKITDDFETMSQEEKDETAGMLDESVIRMYNYWQQDV
jgi:uncharacterized protein